MLLLGDHELLVLLHLLALLVRARPHRLARILHLLWAQHAGQEVVGVQRPAVVPPRRWRRAWAEKTLCVAPMAPGHPGIVPVIVLLGQSV